MAGYFVCGFQVVFIGVHMPSYLKDHGLAPQVASYALALIGLFNVFGTYIAGTMGPQIAKKNILVSIYIGRSVAITLFLLAPLTPTEKKIARYLVNGFTSKEIALALSCSPRTVEVHRANMIRKMGVRNSAEMVSRLLGSPVGAAG
jgi:DNA-binding CsgD family transcriptional regulator